MSKRFIITEEERNSILNTYLKLNEDPIKVGCVKGNCNNGTGTFNYENGNVYVGPFKNNKRHGTGGVLTYPNGDVFRVKYVDDIFNGYGVYVSSNKISYTGLWTQVIDDKGIPIPTPKESDSNFIVLYPEELGGYEYRGYFNSDGFNGSGLFKFPDGTTYTGEFTQEGLSIKKPISFDGVDNENNEVSTEDLIKYHTNNKFKEPVTDFEKIVYTDENRKNWRGCNRRNIVNIFNGTSGTKDYGYQKDYPEFGWAKFEGSIGDKNVKIDGCWDKFKILRGKETGSRGEYDGYYYSTELEKGFFVGDESNANKFLYGTLKNSPEYTFYDSEWEYIGFFVNGRIDTTNANPTMIPVDMDMPSTESLGKIKFSDNNVYIGNFKNGQIEGNGEFKFSSGLILKGNFKLNQESETITYSVTLENGQVIPDIFNYDLTYKQSQTNPTNDKTIGILKTGTIRGTTFYSVDFTDGTKTKNEKGLLPNVFIRISNVEDTSKFFEVTSDDDGLFAFENVPYGKYSLIANINGNNQMSLNVESFDFNTPTKDVRLTLKPLESFQKFINKTVKKSIENGEKSSIDKWKIKDSFINVLYEQSKSDTFISDILKGRFEQKYGTVTTKENCVTQLNNYADLIRKIQKGEIDLNTTKTIGTNLRPTKKYIQNCWRTYPNAMKNQKDDFLLVRNPGGDITEYAIVLENTNKQDIYNKNSMGLNNTISKIVTDYKLNKERVIQEEKIIENRIKFVMTENVDSIINVIKEKNDLLNKGYDGKVVDRIYNKLIRNRF
jgi:hypothetical protein